MGKAEQLPGSQTLRQRELNGHTSVHTCRQLWIEEGGLVQAFAHLHILVQLLGSLACSYSHIGCFNGCCGLKFSRLVHGRLRHHHHTIFQLLYATGTRSQLHLRGTIAVSGEILWIDIVVEVAEVDGIVVERSPRASA